MYAYFITFLNIYVYKVSLKNKIFYIKFQIVKNEVINIFLDRQMKVIACGFPKCGTKTLALAFTELGLNNYDYEEQFVARRMDENNQ